MNPYLAWTLLPVPATAENRQKWLKEHYPLAMHEGGPMGLQEITLLGTADGQQMYAAGTWDEKEHLFAFAESEHGAVLRADLDPNWPGWKPVSAKDVPDDLVFLEGDPVHESIVAKVNIEP